MKRVKQPSESPPARDLALDALRGLALLLMVAAGRMPWDPASSLPAWMYHAQEPPPSHVYNPDLSGLTWVDLVFPLFLFAMGAAIPLASARRLEKDPSPLPVILHTVQRGSLLIWFALYRCYVDPYRIQADPGKFAWALAILAFLLLFPMFTRLPDSWNVAVRSAVRLLGFGGGLALLYTLYHHTSRHFSLGDSDIILMVLANMAVFGGLIWLCTRDQPLIRLGVMGLLVASRLASAPPGWVHRFYNASRLPFPPYWVFDWFFQPDFEKYLLIVLPGTIAGDLLLRWRQERKTESGEKRPHAKWAVLALLSVGLVAVLLTGLEARWLVPTTLLACAVCGVALWLTSRPTDSTERLIHALIRWGSYWIVLGLTLEPFQGGIKKDSATLSYLFLTPGIACYLLSGLLVVNGLYRHRHAIALLADVGQNPMIGYVGMQNFILPLFALTGLSDKLSNWFVTPWMIALRGGLETLLLAYFVRLCGRLRLYWRT